MPTTLLDLLDDAVARYGDRTALSLRRDDGSTTTWTYRELDRRSRIAAWRLRALGLEPGDRVLTWSPSTPELPAAYFGAMRARLIIVPLDLRMSADAVVGIVKAAEPRHLILGTGRDAPDPREAGLGQFPTTSVEALSADPDASFPPDWESQVAGWPRPAPDEIFELVFTSGTTGTPKGVMLAHDNVGASIESFHRIVPAMDHRLVSLLPLSHLLEQAVGLYYALSVGAEVLYVRSRNPRVIFDALRDHRVTSMVVVPQILDLFWSAIEREVGKRGRTAAFDRLRGSPGICPPGCGAACSGASTPSWAGTSGSSSRPAPSFRRRSSRAGRTSASRSCRATARPRPGPAAARPSTITASARSGGRLPGSRCGSRTTGRSSSAAPPCSRATGAIRPPRPPPSRRMAGIEPATSATSTRPAG